MNRIYTIIFATILTTSLFSCKDPLVYKFQNRPQLIECEGADKALLHEALYSFQEDIANFYNNEGAPLNTDVYINGYANFILPGLDGTASYHLIASKHTLLIWEKLKEIDGLWNADGTETHLNYDHPYVACLLNEIQDQDLKSTFENLRKVNHLSPKIMSPRLQGEVENVITDPHLAMYVALDGFYQHLLNVKVFINE